MNNHITNTKSAYFPLIHPKQPGFKGTAPVEKLGKDVFVGVRDCLIQETAFFRKPEIFEFIKDYVITALKHKPEINIIDGACSKGYETYTLAMLFSNTGKKVNILGFDIGKNAIDEAKKGVFDIQHLTGNKNAVSVYKMGFSAYDDSYLAFPGSAKLKGKQAEYKKLFDEFFTEIENYKPKRSYLEILKEKLFPDFTPHINKKAFKIKPEKANCCSFIQGDILKLDEIVPQKSADVLMFRNALYHLTTKEGPLGFKTPLPDEIIIPAVKNVVHQVDKALNKNGLFVIGENDCDHVLTTRNVLYSALEKLNFSPVLKNSDGSMYYIWRKN